MRTIDEYQEQDPEPKSGGIGFADILRMLFKHKGKIMLFALLGFGAAAAVYFTHTPVYESTSKIFVRYVEEISNVDDLAGTKAMAIDSVIGAEVEILSSWDLANSVADQVTPAVLVGTPDATRSAAAQQFAGGLEVVAPKGSRVITVTYRHPDPKVAVDALTALVKLYQERHVDIHRAKKSRETARSRRTDLNARITQHTEQIEQIKAENGISSLPEAASGLNQRSDQIRAETAKAEVDLEEQKARVSELKRLGYVKEAASTPESDTAAGPAIETAATPDAAPSTPSTAAATTPDHSAHLEYQRVSKDLTRLYDEETVLNKTYSPESSVVKAKRREIAQAEASRLQLEKDHPSLLAVGPAIRPGAPLPPSVDPLVETIRLATLSARVELLQKRQDALKEEFKQFSEVSKRIHNLERERDLQTEGLKQFAGAFQRAEFEQPLSAEDYDNIVVVQSSSPPVIALGKLMKIVAGLGAGGLVLGLALAAFLELVLNRSVKRPLEIETRVGIPLMCHIPQISARHRRPLQDRKNPESNGALAIEAWSTSHFIRPYAESIRDRLVLHFEQIGLTRKPKLVGVASHSRGAGVSTVASGIAAALSETGDGKVLLVDMNPTRAEVHPFFDGKLAASLTEALEVGTKMESAADNLYLATAIDPDGKGGGGQLFPKRFYDMLPNFQASDFDYIIFDMPPMDESSLTLAMSGFMDKLLLVVEAEKDNRESVKRASAELLRARAKLSGVLNKTRSYGPKWLQEA